MLRRPARAVPASSVSAPLDALWRGRPAAAPLLARLSSRRAFGAPSRAPSRSARSRRLRATEVSAGAASDALATVWVKRTDVRDAPYLPLEGVDLQTTVGSLVKRWAEQEKFGAAPSLVRLLLVSCGAAKPASADETKAQMLDSTSTLAKAGVKGMAWLLAETELVLHNVTFNFDMLTDDDPPAPMTMKSLSASGLKEMLRQFDAFALAPMSAEAATRRVVLREFDDLHSNSSYWFMPSDTDSVRKTVKELQRHNGKLAPVFEHAASECLVTLMRETGHPEAKRVCDVVCVPDGRGKKFEVDGVVLADECAVVLEAKNRLTEAAAIQLQRVLDIIRALKDRPDCPPELKMFAGKKVFGALAGRIIKSVVNPQVSSQTLCAQWEQQGFTVLLPSGDGLSWMSSCHFTVS